MECSALKDFSETIANAWRRALKAIQRRGYSPTGLAPGAIADPGVLPLIDATASALDSAISRAPLSDAMRQRLSESNYIFSGLKTFHSLNEAFPSMVDSDGNLKPFEQFLNDVQKIERQYNVNYLRAEYNFAVASAQSAARWEQIAADGDRYDLQYRTASDSRVRPEHAALHGVTLPPSSPFWDSFMPPNGWNCRCTAVQVRKGKYPHTDVAEAIERGEHATIRDTRGMMRFNPGKLGKTFPDYNPYSIRRCRDCDLATGTSNFAMFIADNEVCEVCRYLRTCLEQKRTTNYSTYRSELIDEASHIESTFHNLKTGILYQTRKSFKRAIWHARNIEELEMYPYVTLHASELIYVDESPLGEVKDMTNPKDVANVERKKKRGVTTYHIYEIEVDGQLWQVKTEAFKNKSEAVYHIMKKK